MQFIPVRLRDTFNQRFSRRQQMDFHYTPVEASGPARDPLQLRAAIDQRNYPMVLCLQALRQLTDACPVPPLESSHMQQQLILQGGEPLPSADFLAGPQEMPQAIAEVRQALIIRFAERGR